MWSRVWRLLRDKGNRRVLTFLGGAIIVAIIAGFGVLAVQREAPRGAKPGADAARAEQEALRAKAEAEAASVRAKATRDALLLQEQRQENQRRMREAAEAERLAAALRASAYRQANHGCALGTHLRCLTANDSRTGAVLHPLGCYCETDELATVPGRERIEGRSHLILETGYSLLRNIGDEEPGYGLYSYAILVNDDDRLAKFLGDVFGHGDGDGKNAIPPVEETAAPRSRTNILYIPLKNITAREPFKELDMKMNDRSAFSKAYTKYFYDYKMSRALLNHLCDSPAKEIMPVCEGDLSRGPYIFVYAKPASKLTPVPPPYLFIDLSDVHERAFPEIIAAFKAQVKREDISDGVRINTLRLTVLNITLKAADWLVPVQKAMADIVYSASGQAEKDKK